MSEPFKRRGAQRAGKQIHHVHRPPPYSMRVPTPSGPPNPHPCQLCEPREQSDGVQLLQCNISTLGIILEGGGLFFSLTFGSLSVLFCLWQCCDTPDDVICSALLEAMLLSHTEQTCVR
eukprot:GGOE01031633.1.p6 GENE.GGOE01031633.1~~GGOE01031633.1.p6  ORF type:complete len:119 (-),score=3.99 GGOE01031633.1:669-1025(-)